jgi:hypothetical protein
VIVRLKQKWSQECETWNRRDLSQKHYLYVWADGIYVNVRLEDDANRRQCLSVLMEATSEGKRELIAVIDGYRESEQSWTELLLDLQGGVCRGGCGLTSPGENPIQRRGSAIGRRAAIEPTARVPSSAGPEEFPCAVRSAGRRGSCTGHRSTGHNRA